MTDDVPNESDDEDVLIAESPATDFRIQLDGHLVRINNDPEMWTMGERLMTEFSLISDLNEPWNSVFNMMLLRSVYVWPEFRKQGLLDKFLTKVTRISEETACCVVSVANPFELAHTSAKHDSFPTGLDGVSIAERRRIFIQGVGFRYLQGNFRRHQSLMNQRFKDHGFRNISLRELRSDRKRCPRNCWWSYIPKSCDPEFAKELKKRTF